MCSARKLLSRPQMLPKSRSQRASPMTPQSRWGWRGGLTVALLVGVLLGCTGIREDEFVCEDAVSHLQQCCPGFVAGNVDCSYEPAGCEENPVYPEISISESTCIRGESCNELRSTGVCTRAIAVPAGTAWADASESSNAAPSFPRVCP
jgi:hypothetical protein